jgi:uncharacterized protein (TIGR03066 family)
MLTMTTMLMGVVFAEAAPVPKEIKKKSFEDRLVGKWKMIASDNGVSSNFFVVYKKGGEMELRYEDNSGRASTVYHGKFKAVEPDENYKLGSIDWTVKQGNRERGEVSKILELTDDILEFEDPEGVKEKFERVKENEK